MSGVRVFVTGVGIICAAGAGCRRLRELLWENRPALRPVDLFRTAHMPPAAAGQVPERLGDDTVPRAHRLALIAAREALNTGDAPPDAVIVGGTAGGMLTTEDRLKSGRVDHEAYRYHGMGTVAEFLAEQFRCTGPVMTVSNACASGAAAVGLGMDMIRSGRAREVLVGGVDALCRLTYYGFHSLQLLDPEGARPFDRRRSGMSLGEGAAMLRLTGGDRTPAGAVAEVLGCGLSCDAFHPTRPHPEGDGAVQAIREALREARLLPGDIDYIHLHGTGTPDNDRAEARALIRCFGEDVPPHSSVKGALGHTLGAAGAMGAVISVLAISEGFVPANTGCTEPDPELGLTPVRRPHRRELQAVLSNAFGFGGNNAALVLGRVQKKGKPPVQDGDAAPPSAAPEPMTVMGWSCLTGAGGLASTLARISGGDAAAGIHPDGQISEGLDPGAVRRLKRLPRMTLALARAAPAGDGDRPSSVFLGTGWGALSETYDFLAKLYASGETITSPTDFIGSVHNAPAGQAAMHFGASGPNVTVTGGDYSFEQALAAAVLTTHPASGSFLVMGADEYHPHLSELFDSSVSMDTGSSDGGGALCIRRSRVPGRPGITPVCYAASDGRTPVVLDLVRALGGPAGIGDRFGAVMAGIPAAAREAAEAQLEAFLDLSEFSGPVIDYRRHIGEFASASAVAAVLSLEFVQDGAIAGGLCPGKDCRLIEKGVLLLGLGWWVTAVAVEKT